jgi:hypothetical protein
MASGNALHANPRTQQVAARLMADAMQDVSAGMLAGRDHYAERDRVLHELAPAWVKVAGKDAAEAAVRGLHFLDPSAYLKPHEQDALRRQHADERRALPDRWLRLTPAAFPAMRQLTYPCRPIIWDACLYWRRRRNYYKLFLPSAHAGFAVFARHSLARRPVSRSQFQP